MSAIAKLLPIKEHFQNLPEGTFYEVTDVGYRKFQAGEVKGIPEMADWLEEEFGPIAKLTVLLKNYIYQVCNGGHHQYLGNGYASRDSRGWSDTHEEIEMHEELVELVKKHLDIPLQEDLLAILKDFDIEQDTTCPECCGQGSEYVTCSECSGNGEVEVDNDDPNEEDEWEQCGECGGSGEVEDDCCYCGGSGEDEDNGSTDVVNGDALDTRLFDISDEVIEQSEKFIVDILSESALTSK